MIFAICAYSFFCTCVRTCESDYTSALLGSAVLRFCLSVPELLRVCFSAFCVLLRCCVSSFLCSTLCCFLLLLFLRFCDFAFLWFYVSAFLRRPSMLRNNSVSAHVKKQFCKPSEFALAKRNSRNCAKTINFKCLNVLQILQNKIQQILQIQTINSANFSNSANNKKKANCATIAQINSAIFANFANRKMPQMFRNNRFCKISKFLISVFLLSSVFLHFSVFHANRKKTFRKHAQNTFRIFCKPIECALAKKKFAKFCENKQFYKFCKFRKTTFCKFWTNKHFC